MSGKAKKTARKGRASAKESSTPTRRAAAASPGKKRPGKRAGKKPKRKGEAVAGLGARKIAFVPALVALLLAAEKRKGAPLSDREILAIRDNATAAIVTRDVEAALTQERGYPDIDPEDVLAQWARARKKLPVK